MNAAHGMTDDYRELLIGCGRDRKKRYSAEPFHPRGWRSLRDGIPGPVTLDVNPAVDPDIVCDLNAAPPWNGFARGEAFGRELESDCWDEIHAYQVLEHLGQQGDAFAFFRQFSELYRILKPTGYLVAEVPSRFSPWLWGDPSHRRAIVPETLTFLDQAEYIRQCDGPHPSAMSDFRHIYKADFRLIQSADTRENFAFVLQAVKPSRWAMPGGTVSK